MLFFLGVLSLWFLGTFCFIYHADFFFKQQDYMCYIFYFHQRKSLEIVFFFTALFLHFSFFSLCSLPRDDCHILKHLSLGWHCCASLCLSVSLLLRTTQRDDMLEAHPGWVARLQERFGWQDQPSTDYGSNACRQCKTSLLETCRKSSTGNSE